MGKITIDMSSSDVIAAMSENNVGAMSVMKQLLARPTGILDALLLDEMGIYGSEIYLLHNDCCDRNINKLARTLMMFRCGVFSQDEARDNLRRVTAIPFIDEEIEMTGIPPYSEVFGPVHPKWIEWTEAQRKSYLRRIAA